jgi:hypothetical protein
LILATCNGAKIENPKQYQNSNFQNSKQSRAKAVVHVLLIIRIFSFRILASLRLVNFGFRPARQCPCKVHPFFKRLAYARP